MTETAIAERLDDLSQRIETEIRNPALAGILGDMLDLLREIDAARPPPGAMTRAELEAALGGAAFLASLGNMLREIGAAREADVARVMAHVLNNRP